MSATQRLDELQIERRARNPLQHECPTCGDPTDIADRPCRACAVFMRQVTRERRDRTEAPPGFEPFDGELPF
jgi:hypothetical protein